MNKNTNQSKRQYRIRTRLKSRSTLPRLVIKRSNKHIFAQIIESTGGKVICALGSQKLKETKKTKTEIASLVGEKLAELAKTKKVVSLVLDRGSYRYHGRIKAFVEGLREVGVKI